MIRDCCCVICTTQAVKFVETEIMALNATAVEVEKKLHQTERERDKAVQVPPSIPSKACVSVRTAFKSVAKKLTAFNLCDSLMPCQV